MRVVIDTSSLIVLVRYYLPFDTDNNLYELIKKKIQIGDIVILDKVLTECEFLSGGLVIKHLDFLKDKEFKKKYKIPLNTDELIAPKYEKFLRQVDSQFPIGVLKNKLEDYQFELEKQKWLNSADAKLIIYCLNHIHEGTFEEIFLITEESKSNNDLKVFQKIPSICEMLNINFLNLPELIKKMSDEINFDFVKIGQTL